jgi:xanthine dehydrogenase accessory factor
MKEIREILRAYREAYSQNIATAIATVVKVEGSSYRKEGARMLVSEDGRITGAISGGCLEGDALRKALLAIDQKTNKLVTYDTREEGDQAFTIQLGCNGVVHLLFEFIDPDKAHNPIHILEQLVAVREPAVLLTTFSTDRQQVQPGTQLCFRHGDRIAEESGLPADLNQVLEKALLGGKTSATRVNFEGVAYEALMEVVPSQVVLVVVGAGNDTIPLVKAASLIGWQVVVADGRATHATRERFSDADRVCLVNADQLTESIEVGERTLFALMTHNYTYDLKVLEDALSTISPYIGVLGPKTRLNRMLSDLEQRGALLSENQLSRIYGPIGLDIGAETSEEIAIATIAEMKAILNGKRGKPLREKKEKIHSDTVA